jgi:RNA polymerase sigma-70 factor (ECF subfamily)
VAVTTLHLDPADEAQLVQQAREGDLEAFTQLVNRYDSKILRLAKHITQNQEDAEDVLQEAFLKAFTHLDRFEGGSRFYTWLVRIAVNESLMKLRKRRNGKTVSLDEPVETGDDQSLVREIAVWDDTPEARYSQAEIKTILDQAIETLDPIYRTVFVLRDVEELSTEETAQALEISVPAVKSRLLRARLQLREKLTKSFRRTGDNALAYL